MLAASRTDEKATLSWPLYAALALTIGFYCLDYFIRIAPGAVTNQLMSQYHTSPQGLGNFASAFYWGYVLFQLPCGYILERYPLQKVLVYSIALCTLSFIGFIYADIYWVGYLFRWLVGLSSAFSFISVLYLARCFFPERYFGLISGIAISAGTLAGSLVQVLAAYTMHNVDWHSSFLLISGWGIVISMVLILPVFSLLNTRQSNVISNTDHSLSQQIKHLFSNHRFWVNGIVAGLFYLPTSILAAAWGITLLQVNYQVPLETASEGILCLFIGWAVGAPLVGYMSARFKKQSLIIGIHALLAALTSIVLIYYPLQNYALLLMFLLGLFSSAQVLVWRIFSQICPLSMSGVGVALTNMLIMSGGALFHSLVGGLLTHADRNTITYQDLAHSLWLIPTAFLLTACLGQLFLKE